MFTKYRILAGLAGIVVTVAVVMTAAYVALDGGGPVPSYEEVRARQSGSDAVLYDRHGAPLQEMRVDFDGRKLEWTAIGDVSPALVKAVVMSEDRRFYWHRGVDWAALCASLARAASSRLTGGAGGARGASTITMQLAGMLDGSLKPSGGRRSLSQKWRQIRAARAFERGWSKARILEAYLNLVYFRGELQGVSAASRGLYGKDPSGLNVPESMILAALIRSPNADAGLVAKRAAGLLSVSGAGASGRDAYLLAQEVLTRPYILRPKIELAPQVAMRLLSKEHRSATCTLDAPLQRAVSELLVRQLGALSAQNVRDGAVLVADNRTGEVLAYVANTGAYASARYVDGVIAPRQAGSTLKPFLYGLAFERRLMTAASLVDDSPLDVATLRGTYSPEDYDNVYRGMVSARVALASSLNIPAVRTLELTGVDEFAARLGRAGFTGLREGDYYGLSLALGAAEVCLWDLVDAYRMLANGGRWDALRLTPGGKRAARRVYTPEAAYIVSDILSDREARSATFGLENTLSTGYWSAVKTGTSKDMRDNWCVGYTAKYTVGVWVGNFSGEPMWNVSGVTGAAPVWLDVMNMLCAGGSDAGRPGHAPPGLVAKEVEFADMGYRKKEYFIKGTETAVVKLAESRPTVRIVYPSDDTIIAVDPDIPAGSQVVFFESSAGDAGMRWLVDGAPAGAADGLCAWDPVSGRHRLALVDMEGRVLDESGFSVR